MGISTLGNLINSNTNQAFTYNDFIQISKGRFPNKSSSFHRTRGKEGVKIINAIPHEALTALTLNPKPFKEGEIVSFESDNEGPCYGIIYPSNNTIQQVRVDDSGFFTEVGTPYDTSQWEEKDWKGYSEINPNSGETNTYVGVQRVAMWNKLIRGAE